MEIHTSPSHLDIMSECYQSMVAKSTHKMLTYLKLSNYLLVRGCVFSVVVFVV